MDNIKKEWSEEEKAHAEVGNNPNLDDHETRLQKVEGVMQIVETLEVEVNKIKRLVQKLFHPREWL